jgi:hypothetical protein
LKVEAVHGGQTVMTEPSQADRHDLPSEVARHAKDLARAEGSRRSYAARVDRDTDDVGARRYHELLRTQAPGQRAAQMEALTRMVRALAVAGIRARHPAAAEDEIRVRLAVRLYGRAVAERLFVAVPDDAV